MKKKSAIIQQMLTACLLSVFLLITAARLFHSHDSVGHFDFSSGEQVAENSDCPVCDYHFTKDTDHITDVITPAKPVAQSSLKFLYESRTVTSIGLSYSDRGPPALS